MLARLGLVAGLALAAHQAPTAPPEPLVAAPQRQKLRTLASEVARTGELELVERLRDVLLGLGDEPDDLARLMRDWERIALSAKSGRSTRAALANKLRRELEVLVEQLGAESEPRRSELARWILALDDGQPEANATLGRARDPAGLWRTPEELVWDRGARAGAGALRSANRLDFDFERGASDNPAVRQLAGDGLRVATAGIELHAALPAEPLERILRQALRAAALSRSLLQGDDEHAPLAPRRFVLLTSPDQTEAALEEALANGGLDAEQARLVRELDLHSFFDRRGWETFRSVPEANVSAVILWRLLADWVDEETQPCLRVGHLNWLCLAVLGTPIPLALWQTDESGPEGTQRSSAEPDAAVRTRALWRSARQSLWGCRAWMRQEARAGRDPPWARAMLDQDGKIRDAALLKTTLVCEMLQQEGRLAALMQSARGGSERVQTIETALGEPLPELEARWRRWLDPARARGVLQELAREPAPAGAGPFDSALLALNQARSDALKGQDPEVRIVTLEPELSHAAERHARYLTLNPAQQSRWPGVHEELPDAPGFSPEGALAGARAVIALAGDPQQAVRSWLGTFYHRLPLLNPGLFGVGFGVSGEVVVLDAGSLVLQSWKDHVVVWPLPEDEDVPTRFVPELPNPVPGEDMASFGYPITVQLTFAKPEQRVTLTLALFRGAPEAGAAVACHVITPDQPLEPALAPENAWALIPRAPLAPLTRYTARATWLDREKTWHFTTGD